MIPGIAIEIHVPSTDPEASAAWLIQNLGFARALNSEQGNPLGSIRLKCGNPDVFILVRTGDPVAQEKHLGLTIRETGGHQLFETLIKTSGATHDTRHANKKCLKIPGAARLFFE